MFKQSKALSLIFAFTFIFVLSGLGQQTQEETVTCPVSGKVMKKAEAKATYEYQGKTYYFCCEKCKEEFIKNPEKYSQKKTEVKEVYTCSMHPDVKSDKPGKCPKCGMHLEKKAAPGSCPHGEIKHEEKSCSMTECCPMMLKDIEKKIENTKDGVIITLSSKNQEVVKKIQEQATKIKEGKCCQMKKTCASEEKKK